jgi:hypothetical protein
VIKILGYDTAIKYSQPPENGGTEKAGRWMSAQQVIVLGPNVCQQAQESILLHEIIEALDYYLELELDHRVITSLEAGLYSVLTDNGVDLSVLLRDK